MKFEDVIAVCPACNKLSRYHVLMSWNSANLRVWTDGARYAPYPLPPSVVKCAHCLRLHWFSEDVHVGTIRGSLKGQERFPKKWRNAEPGRLPDEHEYYQAIEKGLWKTRAEETTLRLLAWWRSNDPDRDIQYGWFLPGPRSLAGRNKNMTALLALLDETQPGLITKAEIYRELRMWPEALEKLSRINSPSLAEAIARVRALCESKDDKVREIEFPSAPKPRPLPSPEQCLPFRTFEQPLSCPHCHSTSIRFRQVTWRLICPACARSFVLE